MFRKLLSLGSYYYYYYYLFLVQELLHQTNIVSLVCCFTCSSQHMRLEQEILQSDSISYTILLVNKISQLNMAYFERKTVVAYRTLGLPAAKFLPFPTQIAVGYVHLPSRLAS